MATNHEALYADMDDLAARILSVKNHAERIAEKAKALPNPATLLAALDLCAGRLAHAHQATYAARLEFHEATRPAPKGGA